MTDIAPGDYVKFFRAVRPKVTGANKDASGKRHEWTKEEARWIDQSGSGIVDSVNKHKKKIGDEAHRVGRVDAGPVLGKLTVSLDDAVLVGVQQSMSFDLAGAAGPSMYDDGVNHQ